MELSEPKIRYCTKRAINSLASRFSLPNHDGMQDWEYEVADHERISDFFEVYKNELTLEDEKFVLLEMLLQSFEDSAIDLHSCKDWHELLKLAGTRFSIHSYTLWYWSCFGLSENEEMFRVSPFIRGIYINEVRKHANEQSSSLSDL